MSIHKVIANNIKYLRQLKGLSQESLGLDIKTNQSYISAVESERTKISLNRLEQIAKSLGVEPYLLLKKDFKQEIKNEIFK